jgi:hypothetical protein
MYVAYGTFVKPSLPDACVALADQALRDQNLIVLKGADNADYLVVGGNDAVTLTIVCVPQLNGTWVVVSASSGDQIIANQARDVIRGMIEGTAIPLCLFVFARPKSRHHIVSINASPSAFSSVALDNPGKVFSNHRLTLFRRPSP